MRAVTAMRTLTGRIEDSTPPSRDRAVDALRALAILGVVLGHWLVTALVSDSGSIYTTSPLRHMPLLAPVSWLFQTLAVFFLVGGRVGTQGYLAARVRGHSYWQWLGGRLGRLARPVGIVLAVWAVAIVLMLGSGVEPETVRALAKLVVSPLWFLLVFAGLTALTPLVRHVHPLWPVAVVAAVDLGRFALDGPAWLGWVNLAAAWLVPYTLGAWWARRGLPSVAVRWGLLAGGAAATAALVIWAGYPASMVGVTGAKISNLHPPTLAAAVFGLAQCGLALLLHGPLTRVLRRPAAWAAVALANLSAMTIFLWHQTAMIGVTALGMLAGRPLPGLHTVPDGSEWIAARLAWLPVFVVALAGCWVLFRGYERPAGRRSRARRAAAGDGPAPEPCPIPAEA